jgi:hypothetical protein
MKTSFKKPFYSSTVTIISLPLLVFLANGIGIFLFGTEGIQENKIDNVLHGFGGASVCISSAGVLWHLVRRELIVLQDKNMFRFSVFGFLCFVVIGWEVLEYIVLYPSELLTYTDTMSDMICGLFGGLLTMLFFRIPNFSKNCF